MIQSGSNRLHEEIWEGILPGLRLASPLLDMGRVIACQQKQLRRMWDRRQQFYLIHGPGHRWLARLPLPSLHPHLPEGSNCFESFPMGRQKRQQSVRLIRPFDPGRMAFSPRYLAQPLDIGHPILAIQPRSHLPVSFEST